MWKFNCTWLGRLACLHLVWNKQSGHGETPYVAKSQAGIRIESPSQPVVSHSKNWLIWVLYLFCWIPILQRIGYLKMGHVQSHMELVQSWWWNEGKARTQAATEWKGCLRFLPLNCFCPCLLLHLLQEDLAMQRPHPGKARVWKP